MVVGPSDLRIVNEWITDIAQDFVNKRYVSQFIRSCQGLFKNYMDTYDDDPRSRYQLIAICSIYVTSCVYSDVPFSLDTLWYSCDECYTKDQILDMVILFVSRLSISPDEVDTNVPMGTTFKDTEHSKCFRLGDDHVCKVIKHNKNGLPSYDAITEIFVDGIVSSNNVIQLLGCTMDKDSTKLYYDYVPYSLSEYFGSTDHALLEKVIIELLYGLKSLHDQGIAHRDLKGDNIMLDEHDHLKIIDMGAAGFGKLRNTIPVCTITHRSPDILKAEIVEMKYEYDGKKLDIWSVGVLLTELYLGTQPFGSISSQTPASTLLTMIINNKPKIIAELTRIAPPYIVDMTRSCLSDTPDDRPTVESLLELISTNQK